jgi:hypothetical protein
MTGLDPGARQAIRVALAKDFRSLGLDTSGVPGSLTLCLGCAARYMKSFNAELARVQSGRVPGTREEDPD